MKLPRKYTLVEICKLIQCDYIGEPTHGITGLNEIHMVESGDIVFVDHPKYYEKALKSAATTIIIDKEVECPTGKALILSKSPFDDFNRLTRHFMPESNPHESKNQTIHPSSIIFPHVFIGSNVKIGENCKIMSGASIQDNCIIENNVIIGPNTVIGHYAFYYKKKVDGYHRLHSCGGVHIKENVEVGALCTIDAGVSGMTTIGRGTKIDNQVHIGHDTQIGEHCLMASGVGIAGCVTIKNNVTLWGQVGCASNVVIENNVVVYAQSGIGKNLEEGKTYFGSPCGEAKEKFKELVALKKLPTILDKLTND
ncbi:MAG: UDP-3-O-(3-hydroxymyristoyl)glucosamine N-acyltransferase [Crocinitomicaceae bacterium]|nr:UDP-3-O-(3-hydroxymyristoyl)glucosamine N-acyltransferase [Crocinitomicaceae bacterium]